LHSVHLQRLPPPCALQYLVEPMADFWQFSDWQWSMRRCGGAAGVAAGSAADAAATASLRLASGAGVGAGAGAVAAAASCTYGEEGVQHAYQVTGLPVCLLLL